MRVAIVEDLQNWQEIIKTAFEEENHAIVGVFSNTSEATYKAILKCQPDILMMDIELEIKSAGIELVKKLNQAPSFQDTNVVFLTSLEDDRFHDAAYNTKATIASYIEKVNFQNGRQKRTVKEIIRQVENRKPSFITVHGTKVFTKNILWVTIDKDYEEMENKKRIAIIFKDENNDKNVIYAYTADLKDFTDHERESVLYAKGKLIPISKDTLVNIDNAPHLTHTNGTRDYFIHFSLDKKDLNSRLQMSQRIGAELYKKYVR